MYITLNRAENIFCVCVCLFLFVVAAFASAADVNILHVCSAHVRVYLCVSEEKINEADRKIKREAERAK